MTFIITVSIAVIFSILYLTIGRKGRFAITFSTCSLMFWSAAIMWSVDGLNSVINGGSFLDLSQEDLYLGIIIAVAGVLLFLISMLIEVCRSNRYNAIYE
ncbi:hypothetical protein [Treponema sp.]|uniref:hypothetical protein n=1 Tax=Treponema sp. TaxID=166 RepID=UPI0025EDE2B4|nr:hypothetical protein [Treponema sp.]MCR5217411.1 hypothetical protein [Treponema sp.]